LDTAILYCDRPGPEDAHYPIIGEQATLTYGHARERDRDGKGYRYYANFKPEIAGREETRQRAVDFFKAIAREAQKMGVALGTESAQVIVGAPSEAGWQFRETLKSVFLEAGLGAAEVVDEPKGVLLTDLGYNRFPLGDILDGYLVIDFGGGTCDFALMRQGEVVGSWGDMELGGRLFDDLFYQWFLEQNRGLGEKIKAERREFYVWSYLCRILKEDFSETMARNPKSKVSSEVGRFGTVKDLTVDEFMERASSYAPSEAFLAHAEEMGLNLSDNLKAGKIDLIGWYTKLLVDGIKGAKVKAVSLSGGSSKWFFVRDICESILGLGADRILVSLNPFGAISEGLAILPAVKADLESARAKMLSGKDDFIALDLVPQIEESLREHAGRLADSITQELFDDRIAPIIKAAAGGSFKISELETQIAESVDGYRDRLGGLAEKEIGEELLALKAIVQSKVQAWLDTFGLRLEGRLRSESAPESLFEVDRPLIGQSLTKPLFSAASGFVYVGTGLLTASVCGGSGMALLTAGPLGLLLGALGGLGLVGLGHIYGREKIERFVKDRELPKFLAGVLTTDKKIAKVRQDFRQDMLNKVNGIYKDLMELMPQEIDDVIYREINQLGIVNVF
jgi:hypothetical protein